MSVPVEIAQEAGPEAAVEAVFGIPVNTLRWYRRVGGGPPFCQPAGPGGKVTYLFSDVRAWLEASRVTPSET